MNSKKLFSLAVPVVLAAVKVFAIAPAPESPPESINAVIGSESGKERRLQGRHGYIGRAGLRPNQKVRVTLQWPGSQKGEPVVVASLDGGIIPGSEVPKVAPDGTLSFKFEAGPLPGLYRVLVEVRGQQHLLEFYVLDTTNPGRNPPRVKIVD